MAELPDASTHGLAVSLRALVLSLRPRQWTKNLLLYFAFFFTIDQRWDPANFTSTLTLFGQVTAAFALFCLLSGASYIINDLADLEQDRRHPRKRLRPLASGQLPSSLAMAIAALLLVIGVAGSFLLRPAFGIVALTYVVITLCYSAILKRLVILDILTISAGFVLRAAAGAAVIDVPISPWLYVCTGLGALFLGFGKRRNELALSEVPNPVTRQSLEEYSLGLLDALIALVAPATLIAYILYTFTAENLPENHAMMLTIPFVAYGLFRYLYLMHRRNLGESPEEILLTDIPLIVDILLWLATSAAILLVYR